MSDITIFTGRVRYNPRKRPEVWRLYYFQGNFFYPLALPTKEMGQVRRLIRIFLKDNREMVGSDRSAPGYKNVLQLFDEQTEVCCG